MSDKPFGLDSALAHARTLKPYSNMAISAGLVIDVCEHIDRIRAKAEELEAKLRQAAPEPATVVKVTDSGFSSTGMTVAYISTIAEKERANNRVILDSSDDFREVMKTLTDRQLADAVNELRDIAIKFHSAGQLRERIARVVRGLVRGGGE